MSTPSSIQRVEKRVSFGNGGGISKRTKWLIAAAIGGAAGIGLLVWLIIFMKQQDTLWRFSGSLTAGSLSSNGITDNSGGETIPDVQHFCDYRRVPFSFQGYPPGSDVLQTLYFQASHATTLNSEDIPTWGTQSDSTFRPYFKLVDLPTGRYRMGSFLYAGGCYIYSKLVGTEQTLFIGKGCSQDTYPTNQFYILHGSDDDKWRIKSVSTGLYVTPAPATDTLPKRFVLSEEPFEFTAPSQNPC